MKKRIRYLLFLTLCISMGCEFWVMSNAAAQSVPADSGAFEGMVGKLPQEAYDIHRYLKRLYEAKKEGSSKKIQEAENEHIHNAYIFIGSRGTGKTRTMEEIARQSDAKIIVISADEKNLDKRLKLAAEDAKKIILSKKPIIFMVKHIDEIKSELLAARLRAIIDEFENNPYMFIILTARSLSGIKSMDKIGNLRDRCFFAHFSMPRYQQRVAYLSKQHPDSHQVTEAMRAAMVTRHFSYGDLEQMEKTGYFKTILNKPELMLSQLLDIAIIFSGIILLSRTFKKKELTKKIKSYAQLKYGLGAKKND